MFRQARRQRREKAFVQERNTLAITYKYHKLKMTEWVESNGGATWDLVVDVEKFNEHGTHQNNASRIGVM